MSSREWGGQSLVFSLDGIGITGASAGDIFTVDLARFQVEGVSAAVPEPSSLALASIGCVVALGIWFRGPRGPALPR